MSPGASRENGTSSAYGKGRLSRVGEFIGLVGVIGSLIFVGIEVRQSTLATRAATDAVIADAFRELNSIVQEADSR